MVPASVHGKRGYRMPRFHKSQKIPGGFVHYDPASLETGISHPNNRLPGDAAVTAPPGFIAAVSPGGDQRPVQGNYEVGKPSAGKDFFYRKILLSISPKGIVILIVAGD